MSVHGVSLAFAGLAFLLVTVGVLLRVAEFLAKRERKRYGTTASGEGVGRALGCASLVFGGSLLLWGACFFYPGLGFASGWGGGAVVLVLVALVGFAAWVGMVVYEDATTRDPAGPWPDLPDVGNHWTKREASPPRSEGVRPEEGRSVELPPEPVDD